MSVDIPISATDAGATSTIDSVNSSLQGLQTTADTTTTSTASLTSTLSTSTRVGDTALLAVDRMQISQDMVTNATIRHELAQTRLSDAVTKYGANSEQARKAQEEMTIATDNLTTAHIRQEERMASTALIAIPRMISGLKELSASLKTTTVDEEGTIVATEGLTAANAAAIAVASLGVAVPALLAGLALVQGANFGGGGTVQNNLYGNVYNNGMEPTTAAQTSTLGWAQSAR